jgi:hypothetical protein
MFNAYTSPGELSKLPDDCVTADFARTLERELAAALARVRVLEEALKDIVNFPPPDYSHSADPWEDTADQLAFVRDIARSHLSPQEG